MNNHPTILQIFASRSWGGGEQYVFDLGRALMKQGYQVFFASQKSTIIKKKLHAIDKRIYFFKVFGYFDIISIFRIAHFVKKKNIQIIHTHKFNHAFLCVFVKLLLSRRNLKIILTRHLVRPAKTMKMYIWLYRQIDRIVFVSKLAKEEFLSTHPDIDIDKIDVIYNSSFIDDKQPFDKMDLRTKYKLSDQTILLGFSGRLSQEKGIEVLIDAIALLPKSLPIHLFIAGDGRLEYKQKIQHKIQQLRLENQITFIGFCDTIIRFIDAVDIAVLPSVQQESFGLSMIEFMQMQKPVITTNNGAQKEYITSNKNGILVDPNNAKQLALAIQSLCIDQSLREYIGQQAYQTFWYTLSYDKFMQHINLLYDKVLNCKKYRILIDLSKLQGVYCGLWEFSYQFGKHIIEHLADNPQWDITFLVSKNHPYHSKSIKYLYVSWIYRYTLWLRKPYHIVHALSQNSPYIRFKNKKTKYISTIHDLNFLYEKKGRKLIFYQQKYQANLEGLDHIVFISTYTALDAKKYLSLPCSYTIILNGININHHPHPEVHPIMDTIKDTPFIFIVATVMRKKNMHTLVAMMKFLPHYKLVVAGQVLHPDYYQKIKKKIQNYQLQDRIFIIGAISEEQKAYFYENCSAFVFPSLAEGFGAPPIEAMSYGKPVFVSDKTSIPEICGNLAFYWKKFEPEYMARIFNEGMNIYNTEENYAQRLKDYTQKYDWNRCIKEYIDLYLQRLKNK